MIFCVVFFANLIWKVCFNHYDHQVKGRFFPLYIMEFTPLSISLRRRFSWACQGCQRVETWKSVVLPWAIKHAKYTLACVCQYLMDNEINNSEWLQMKLLSLCQIVIIMQRIVMSMHVMDSSNRRLVIHVVGDTEKRRIKYILWLFFKRMLVVVQEHMHNDGIVSNSMRWNECEVSFQPYYKWIKLHNIFIWWQKSACPIYVCWCWCRCVMFFFSFVATISSEGVICWHGWIWRTYDGMRPILWAPNVFSFRLK